MKSRYFYFGLAVVSALLTVAVLLFVFSQISPALAKSSGSSAGISQQPSTILARRLISVPFGVNAVNLVGDQLQVSGWGECDVGGTFSVRVNVGQHSSKARALGTAGGFECVGEQHVPWTLTADVVSNHTFITGEDVKACSMAFIYPESGSVIVSKWCPSVELK
jgi:hypothetical protein